MAAHEVNEPPLIPLSECPICSRIESPGGSDLLRGTGPGISAAARELVGWDAETAKKQLHCPTCGIQYVYWTEVGFMEDDTNFKRIDSLGFITKASPSRLSAHLEMLRGELYSDNVQARNRAARILLDPSGDLALSDLKLILNHSDPGVQRLGFILGRSAVSEHCSELMEDLLFCMQSDDNLIRDKAGKVLFRNLDDADIPTVSALLMKAVGPRVGEYWPVRFIQRIQHQKPDLDITPYLEVWAEGIWDDRNTVVNRELSNIMGTWAENSPERTHQLFSAIDAARRPGSSHVVDFLRGWLLEGRKEEATHVLSLATGGRGPLVR